VSPLRMQPDYGEKEFMEGVNPYLNTPPTKLNRDIKREKDPKKRRLMKRALNAWRITVPGPFRKGSREHIARELLRAARELL